MSLETIISICLGIGLSASVGFRVFLPLFALSLATFFDVWQLNDSWQWIGSTTALITLGVATVVEIFAYFIPYVDNLLDSISVPLAALAGTAVMLSTVSDLSPVVTWALAIIAGGGTAAAISGTSSATRLTSTATTGGMANPIVSTVETGTSIIMSIVSIFLPFLAIILVFLLFFVIFKFYKKFTSPKIKNH
ncbi:uncharacterized protein DUF4126 [Mariniflexile fucanivorans]|uniref:Uncharacterized protein DUF4126 n=1 Tax=Mariniflexile fucanivorans TaxID=264023 RepID=A0A4R1RGE3_9FLAO|nr:DUF4126 domain-containing protein [Mariniflexile fucanivorans]TCL65041.1 uncharacterized protein DUF4126 [Mariniflexile fucanivorans]